MYTIICFDVDDEDEELPVDENEHDLSVYETLVIDLEGDHLKHEIKIFIKQWFELKDLRTQLIKQKQGIIPNGYLFFGFIWHKWYRNLRALGELFTFTKVGNNLLFVSPG